MYDVYFKYNTSVTRQKQGAVRSPQHKQMPMSTADSSVSISSLLLIVGVQKFSKVLWMHL
jgi:hypothetical protein